MKAVCPGHSAPFQAIADAFFARSPAIIWIASRGFGGKTMALASLAFAESVTLQSSVTLLGGSGEQAARVHKYLRDFWRSPNAPKHVLASDPAKQKTTLLWGNEVTALMASMASVSGPHPQRLLIDEADLVDLDLVDQALGQPMGANGVDPGVVFSSARYTADGTLDTLVARAKERGWICHEWCWKESLEANRGWLRQAEVDAKRTLVTSEMWKVQYDLQEPDPSGLAIDRNAVESMFSGPVVESEGESFSYREFEPPVFGASYATGADWARTRDFVSIPTLRYDVSPIRLVAYQQFRRKSTQYILAQVAMQTRRYPGQMAHDATSLGGQMMCDLIDVGDTSVEGVAMLGQTRKDLFTDYIIAVERGRIIAPRVDTLYRQHRRTTNDDLWGSGHPPDGVVAMAMASRAAMTSGMAIGTSVDDGARQGEPQAGAFGQLAQFFGGGNGNGNGHG